MDGIANALTDHPLASLVFTCIFVPLFHLAKESQASRLKWINDHTAIWWNAGTSLVTALGIHISVSHTGPAHQAVIDWTTSGIVEGLIEIGRQFVAQHSAHIGLSTFLDLRRVIQPFAKNPEALQALVAWFASQKPALPPAGGGQ